MEKLKRIQNKYKPTGITVSPEKYHTQARLLFFSLILCFFKKAHGHRKLIKKTIANLSK